MSKSYFSVNRSGSFLYLRFLLSGLFVAEAPDTPVNRTRLYRLGVRLTFYYRELKNFGVI